MSEYRRQDKCNLWASNICLGERAHTTIAHAHAHATKVPVEVMFDGGAGAGDGGRGAANCFVYLFARLHFRVCVCVFSLCRFLCGNVHALRSCTHAPSHRTHCVSEYVECI